MKRVLADPFLFWLFSTTVAVGQPIEAPSNISPGALKALNGTSWIDIGLGKDLNQLSPAEIVKLHRCDSPTMYFESWMPNYIDQVYVAAISMRSHFIEAVLTQSNGQKTISLARTMVSSPSTILVLSKDGRVLIDKSPHFYPHIYLRCDPVGKK